MSNSKGYFEVVKDNKRYAHSWFLGEPLDDEGEEIDARLFTYCDPYRGPPPRNVPIDVGGQRVAFNLAAFDMPIITEKIADAIEEVAPGAVERYPVLIDSHIDGYEILNALTARRCVDEQASEIMWWKEEDGRPDKTGKYRQVANLTIDSARAGGSDIFRIEDWNVLIVCDRLRLALERFKDLGVEFLPVTK